MRLIQFNDAHIRGSTPFSRLDDYPETLWCKFQQLTDFIKEFNIDAVLNGGDLFDTPDPSTGVANKYLELFKSWGIPIYSVVGSHDLFGYNDRTLGRTALGTLRASGVVSIVGPTQKIGDNCQLGGISHSYSLDENSETDYYLEKVTDDFMIQLCHGMITEGPFFGKYTLYSQIKTEADLVICGHYHPGFGPFEVDGSTIINIGSMGRTENTTRNYPPGFLYIDTSVPKWEFIPLKTDKDPFVSKSKIDPLTIVDVSKFIENLKKKVGDFEKSDLKGLLTTIGEEQDIPLRIIRKALGYIEEDEQTTRSR